MTRDRFILLTVSLLALGLAVFQSLLLLDGYADLSAIVVSGMAAQIVLDVLLCALGLLLGAKG